MLLRCLAPRIPQEGPIQHRATGHSLTHHSLGAMGPSPHNMLKGFVRSWLGHSLSRAVLVSVAVSDTCRLSFLYRNIDHEWFYNSELQNYDYTNLNSNYVLSIPTIGNYQNNFQIADFILRPCGCSHF